MPTTNVKTFAGWVILSTLLLSLSFAQPDANALSADQECYNAVMHGQQLLSNNDWNNAMLAFRSAQKMQPLDSRPYFWIGYCLENTGDLKGAVKAYADCLNTAKMHGMDSAELRIDLGNTLCKLNYFKEAIFDYRRALIIDPSLTIAHLGLARAYIETRNWQSALQELDVCRKQSLQPPELPYLRALALAGAGARQDAARELEAFVTANKGSGSEPQLMQKAVTLLDELKRP